MLINRLTSHINGKEKLDKSQVSAALGLLKKTLPDLSVQTLVGDSENPIHTVSRIENVVIDAQSNESNS